MKNNAGLLIFVLCLQTALILRAADAPQKTSADKSATEKVTPQKGSSLDEQLLQNLDRSLLNDEPAKPQAKSQSVDKTPEPKSAVDRELERRLQDDIGGEDIGQPPEHPLLHITKQMKDVEELIAQKTSDADTQRLQNQIVAELEKLINTCQKCQASKSGNSSAKNSQPRQPGQSSQNQNPSGQPAAESSKNVIQQNAKDPKLVQPRQLLEQSWGNLPARLREQILEAAGDEFLPQYDEQIRRYFQRLVEEDRQK